jgi:tetratricopeptide (TPR) repeat protein
MTDDKDRIESLMNQGLTLINGNRLAEAKTHYEAVVARYSGDADAWYMLGTVNGRLGLIDAAGECSRRAIGLRPDFGEAHLNLGNVLLHQGRHEEALSEYGKVLALNPRHGGACLNMGHILAALGRDDEAALSYRTALGLDPSGAAGNAIRQQAQTLLQHGRLATAKAVLSVICDCRPDDADAWHLLSTVNGRLGDIDAAAACSRRVLDLRPDHAEAHVNLGHAYFQQGDVDAAAAQYRKALDINPLSVAALNNLGKSCRNAEQLQDYLDRYRRAVARLPDPTPARQVFIEIVDDITPTAYLPWLDEELQKCFAVDGIDYTHLAAPSALSLKHKYAIQPPFTDDDLIRETIARIASDTLFSQYLAKTFNIDPDLELLLTAIRRFLLIRHCAGNPFGEGETRAASLLAHQCANNEYVFALDEEEARLLPGLKDALQRTALSMKAPDDALERALIVYSMYDRLCTLSCREQLYAMARDAWSARLHSLLEETLIHPMEEEHIKGEIRSIGAVRDQTSKLVQSQYEENPYPRWLSLPELRKGHIKRVLAQHIRDFSPPAFLDGPIRILVAGCGTGKHPIQTALSYDNVSVLAVDISKSSLAYAVRMARKYNVKNIEFLHGDILELSGLKERFHIIESVGVLHHMKDPLSGWRVLTGLLVEDGLMTVGLYSELARRSVTAIGDIFRQEGLTPEVDNIRAFRRRLLAGELDGHAAPNSPGFYYTSGCRDLLFHYMEHRYTLPQLERDLRTLGLKFLGFTFGDTRVTSRYRARHPDDTTLTDLASWDAFEHAHPSTFAGMYRFWCKKISA